MNKNGEIVSVNVSSKGGVPKYPQSEVYIDNYGISGDYHSGKFNKHKKNQESNTRPITIVAFEVLEEINNLLSINLKPGEFSIHHVNTVHGSGINKSNKHRIGFAVRYISSDTKHLIEKKGDSAIHVCGKKNSYFSDESRPNKSFSDEAIKIYQKSMNSAGAFGNKKYVYDGKSKS